MALHTKLVSLRKEKGLTQMDLAQKLNVSRQAVSRWEVGAAVPSTDNLKILGELYGVSVDYLLNDNINESVESARGADDNFFGRENVRRIIEIRPLAIIMVAAVVVVMLIITLMPWSNRQDQSMPMEGMSTETKGDYSEGTFEFK